MSETYGTDDLQSGSFPITSTTSLVVETAPSLTVESSTQTPFYGSELRQARLNKSYSVDSSEPVTGTLCAINCF